jgi:uncharacterized protein YeaO (DUF488 family)
MFRLKRVQEAASPQDGKRYLVDRLWPRGVSKERAALDDWLKAVSPSNELRAEFHHDPAKWPEFQRRYREELAAPESQEILRRLRAEAREGTVTLLYAARDTERNNALALKAMLEEEI